MVKITMSRPGRAGRKSQMSKLAYAKRKTSAMKKTTKKGAYNKGKKKNWQNRRRPFVECKAVDLSKRNALIVKVPQTTGFYPIPLLSTEVPSTDPFHILHLDCFTRMTQGYKQYEMIGDSVFSRKLQLKTEITFPSGQNVIVNAFRVYLICGWVTAPPHYSANTTKNVNDVTYNDINAYIVSQVQEYFDDSTDRLVFNEKVRQNIKIDKYSRVLPKTAESVFGPATENVTAYATSYGAPAKVERRHTWQMNRKIHYTKGAELIDSNTSLSSGDELIQNWYPNDQWLPFAVIYMPDNDKMVNQQNVQQNISIRYNVLHTYSDS